MSLEIRMPQIAADMTEADVIGWLAAPGDAVTEGEPLYEIETDKSTVEIEAPASGVLREIVVPAGSSGIVVGTVLAMLDVDAPADRASGVSEPKASAPRETVPQATRRNTDGPTAAAPAASEREKKPRDERAPADSGGVPATALARRVAERAGLDLSRVAGSGPRGRITRDDVAQQIAGGASERPRPGARRAGSPTDATPRPPAEHEAPSESTDHVATLTTSCRVDAAISVLDRLNAGTTGERGIELIDLVVRASALALREVPDFKLPANVPTSDPLERIDIAVSTGDDQLAPPFVIRDAAEKGLAALSAERHQQAERAEPSATGAPRSGEAAFSIQDLGRFGLAGVSPAAPTNYGGTLGVGAALPGPVVEHGRLVAGTSLTLTLALNPRIGDSRSGAALLAAIARHLEDPLGMVV